MVKDLLKIKIYDDTKRQIYSMTGDKKTLKEAIDELFGRKM